MKSDFFITYHEDDELAARWISSVLREEGLSTILESWYFLPGDSTEEKIKNTLNACGGLMVLLSDEFFKSGFIPETVQSVLEKISIGETKSFIPIHFRTCNITVDWGSIDVIDLVGVKEEEARKRLIHAAGVPNRKEIESEPLMPNRMTRDDILKKREQEYKELLVKTIKHNYHMKLTLEQEVEKVVEVKNKKTGGIDKRKEWVWEKVELKKVLSDRNDYILVNPSGMGKTTFLTYLTYGLLHFSKNYQFPFVPFFTTCIALNNREGSIAAFLSERLNFFYYNLKTCIIDTEWENLCLLIDALDQARNVDDIVSSLQLQEKYGNYKKAKIIISSRQNTADRVKEGFHKIRLKLPEEDEILHYLGEENYKELETFITSSREIIVVPVLLEMLRTIAEEGHISSIMVNRSGLYTEFTRILIDQERRKPRFWQNASFIRHFIDFDLEEVLEKIAFFSLTDNEILEIDKKKLVKYCDTVEKKEALLNIGIIMELFEEGEQKMVFRHQSFQAYFAARYMYYQRPELFSKLTEDIRFFYSDIWFEVMRFFIGLEKDPQKAGGIIDSIFNYGTNVLKKIIKRRKLKSKIYNLIYALRLIFAVCLMSEVRVSNQKVQDLHEKLRALLTNARKYSYVFISNIDKFNTSNNDQRTGILNILLILFRDEDWEIRRAASDAFGKIGTAESISILQPMLRDEVINVRETAIEALSKLGTVKDIPLLQPLLMDKDTDVRSKATQALGKIGTSQHIHFIETLLKDKDEEVQSAAAEALLDMVTVKDIPFLGLLLRDESKDVRRAASDALGTIGTSNDIPLLKPLLKDENEDVRSTAVDNLLKLGAVKDISFLKSLLNNENQWIYRTAAYILMKIGINKDNSILEHLLRNKDMKIRWASAEAIGKIGPSNYISMLEPLLRDVSRHVRSAASEALGNIGSEKDIPLLEPMLSDKNWKVRNAAAYALGNIGTEKDILLLAPLLKDKNRKVRSAAAEALRSIGSEKDIPLLSPLLSDKNWNVRHTAASALLRIGKAQHFALLVPLFIEKGWDDDERSASAALTNMFTEQDIHLLQPLLRDKYKFIRTAATEKLGKIGSSNDIPMLEPQLRDGSRHVRYAAAKALSEIGSEKDILLLQPLLKDNSITVRMGAADALGKLGIENDIPLLQPLLEDNWVIRIASKAIEQIYKRSTPELRIDDDVLPKNGKKESLFFKKAPTHPLHILHISDIHYSQQRYPDIDRIFHEFLGDLTKWQQQRKNEKIHVVCLTGDIANSGMRSQYDAIQEKIKNILSKTGCSNDDLFIVPGNHDVQNYEIISNSGKKTLKEAKKNHTFINFNVLNDFQKYREFNEKFNHYYGFIEKYGYINSQPETHHSISKSLYSRTLVDYPVRIIGLNSALFGIKGFHEYGKIRMGTDQFTEAYLHGKTRNTTTGELVILLTHHPLNWLSEEEYEEFSTLFERYSVVHLHGHIHRLKIRNLFSFSGSSYLSVGTGSLYGAKGTEDINTYHILTFDFEKKEIHIWARRWNPEMGRWTVYDDETRNTFSFPQPRVKTSSD